MVNGLHFAGAMETDLRCKKNIYLTKKTFRVRRLIQKVFFFVLILRSPRFRRRLPFYVTVVNSRFNIVMLDKIELYFS